MSRSPVPESESPQPANIRPAEGERVRTIPYGDSGLSVEIDLEDPSLQKYRERQQDDKRFVAYLSFLADAHYRGYASGRLVAKLFGHLRVGFRECGRSPFNRSNPVLSSPVVLYTLPVAGTPNGSRKSSAATSSVISLDSLPSTPFKELKNADDLCKFWGIGVTEMPPTSDVILK